MKKLIAGTVLGLGIVGGAAVGHAVTQPPSPYDFGVTYVIYPDARPDDLFVRVTHSGRTVRYVCHNPQTGFQQAPDGSYREFFKSDPHVHCPIG